MSLPWLKTSLVKESSDWDFHSTVTSAMDAVSKQGAALMQPVTEQVRSVVQQAMPEPAPMQMPEPQVPEVPTFSLGTLEDWGMGMPKAPQRPPEASGAPGLGQEGPGAAAPVVGSAASGAVTPSSGLFSLGSAVDWLSPITTPTTSPATAARGAPAGAARAGPAAGPSDVNEYLKVAALKAGVDPSQVLAVMGKEGPTGWGSVGTFDTGTSFGPLQLHYAGGSNPKEGMGDRFTKATGIDLRKDSSLQAHQAAVDFAMQELVKRGDWSEWYGADNAFPASHGGKGRFTPIARVTPVQPPTGPSEASIETASQAPAGLDVSGITKAYAGVPYTFGGPGGRGQGLGATTDCSGFVSAVWKNQFGLDLPAHTDTSYNALRKMGAPEVSAADARPGDVVYYMGAGTGGAITHHMGIFAGPGRVLDMSTSGQSGAQVRSLDHAGRYVILRDPRVNQQAPERAQAPPPIVPTGIAERTGGEAMRTVQARTPEVESAPPPQQPEAVPAPAAPDEEMFDPRGADEGPHEGANGAVAQAFRHVNGFLPSPEQLAELVSRVYGG